MATRGAHTELQRIRKNKYKRVDIERSQVNRTVFKTSDEDDGLVVSATEKVITREKMHQMQTLCG